MKTSKKSQPPAPSTHMSKEQERAELHRAIWQIATDLRGSVDGWDFKQYVLGMLFYRFISENLANYINADERRAGKKDFDYATLSNKKAEFGRADTVKEKGFYILPSELFINVRKNARNDANLNETITTVFRNIENSAKGASSEDDIKGLFDDLDVNSNKLGGTVEKRNQKLTKLFESIGDLRLGNYSDNTIDAFGDAYEFLMTMYASNAGKSGGEFYTPQEVSELLAEITTVGKKEVNKVYDPACGSGSLLLKFAKVLGKENVRLGFFGQEINLTTYNLCRINMFLHDINYNNFDIAHGDTLTDPKHWDDEPFDAIVSNPPYSIHWEGDANSLLINDPRFSPAGVLAPKSKADLAFTMHMLSWLSTSGAAAIVEFPGVLYRGGAERKIRKYLIDNNYLDAVIQLPPNLFFGTNIDTCILVLKKSKKDNKTLFIDASAEFVHVGNKNKLTEPNRFKILEAFTARKDTKYFAKLVNNKNIADNDYIIVVKDYVKKLDTREVIDIKELNERITNIISRQNKLRKSINETIGDIKETKMTKNMSKIEKLIADLCPNGLTFKELGELGEFYGGLSGKTKDDFSNGTAKFVTYMNIFSNIAVNTDINDFVKVSKDEHQNKIEYGDVLFTGSSETPDDCGMSSVLTNKINEPLYLNSFCFGFRLHNNTLFLPEFLKYLFRDEQVRKQIAKTANGVTRFNVSKKRFAKIIIPLPPLALQEEIVKILNKFTELEAELEVELDTELVAIKKKYDYYRSGLLTFKKREQD